jgi:hypothetical protein
MSWFDEDAGRPLLAVLHQTFRSPSYGSVSIDGRDGGGQIYFADHEVVFATCDGRVPLRSVLELSGAADHDELARLMRTAGEPLAARGRIPPAVVAVVRDHTEAAFAELAKVRVGRARVELGETPPFGALMSVSLAELARAAALVEVRARAASLRDVAAPPARPAPVADVVEVRETADPAAAGATRSSALRRLIGAMRTPRPDAAQV